MSGSITYARPYAKAIFEHALSIQKLSMWSQMLQLVAGLFEEKSLVQALRNPNLSKESRRDLLLAPFGEDQLGKEYGVLKKLITLLVQNKRLLLIPEIASLFETLRAEHQKTLKVTICTAANLDNAQQQKLQEALVKRFGREVTLEITLDPTLIGGAIIQADNFVIDGSVRGQLEKLRLSLITSSRQH